MINIQPVEKLHGFIATLSKSPVAELFGRYMWWAQSNHQNLPDYYLISEKQIKTQCGVSYDGMMSALFGAGNSNIRAFCNSSRDWVYCKTTFERNDWKAFKNEVHENAKSGQLFAYGFSLKGCGSLFSGHQFVVCQTENGFRFYQSWIDAYSLEEGLNRECLDLAEFQVFLDELEKLTPETASPFCKKYFNVNLDLTGKDFHIPILIQWGVCDLEKIAARKREFEQGRETCPPLYVLPEEHAEKHQEILKIFERATQNPSNSTIEYWLPNGQQTSAIPAQVWEKTVAEFSLKKVEWHKC